MSHANQSKQRKTALQNVHVFALSRNTLAITGYDTVEAADAVELRGV